MEPFLHLPELAEQVRLGRAAGGDGDGEGVVPDHLLRVGDLHVVQRRPHAHRPCRRPCSAAAAAAARVHGGVVDAARLGPQHGPRHVEQIWEEISH